MRFSFPLSIPMFQTNLSEFKKSYVIVYNCRRMNHLVKAYFLVDKFSAKKLYLEVGYDKGHFRRKGHSWPCHSTDEMAYVTEPIHD